MQSVIDSVKDAISGASLLPTRQLGKDGPQVTAMGYGTMGLSAFYGKPKPDNERFAMLDHVYAKGELFWDTADVYQDSEDLLGKWFKANPGAREKIFLATKFANKWTDTGMAVDTTPGYCIAACNKSLSRLGIDCIDLYYAHRVDGKTPIESTVTAMAKLKQEGKIKYLGLSECSSATLRRAHAVHPIAAVQVEYSPFALEIESKEIDLLATARELGVAIVAYSPIGRGMLSGAITSPDQFEDGDFRKHAPRFSEENFAKNIGLVEKIKAIAEKKGVTPAQLTLAWLMSNGEDVLPIPGTTSKARLDENLGALSVVLSEAEKKEIREASEAVEVAGARYPEGMSSVLYGDTPELDA